VLGVQNQARHQMTLRMAGDGSALEQHVIEIARVIESSRGEIASSPCRSRWKAATTVGVLAIRRTVESQLLWALVNGREPGRTCPMAATVACKAVHGMACLGAGT